MKPFKINKECRLCKSKLEKIINIGPQPLANQFLKIISIKGFDQAQMPLLRPSTHS